ncbi:MAG: FHA domain-containing protein [Chthoniobacterales bacterium]|nr:FHA domain-containing protein [Chthoniobacterales bacterium]
MSVMEKQQRGRLPVFKIYADQGNHPPVKLDRPVCVVGRREGTNLSLDAEQVSKFHALIVHDAAGVYLRDLASTNGVQLNGQAVAEVTLTDEDTIRIGSFTLQCASGFSEDPERRSAGTDASSPEIELVADGKATSVPAGKNSFIIGRRASCELQLNDASVAPVHAAVFKVDGQWMVRAFSTPEGTKLNGASVHQSALSAGDELAIGETTFTVRLHDTASIASDDELLESVLAPGASGILIPEDSFAAEDLSTPGIEPAPAAELPPQEDSADLSEIGVVTSGDAGANEALAALNAVDAPDDESATDAPVDVKSDLTTHDSLASDDSVVADDSPRLDDVDIVSEVSDAPLGDSDASTALPVASPELSGPLEIREESNAETDQSVSSDDLLPVDHEGSIVALAPADDAAQPSATAEHDSDLKPPRADIAQDGDASFAESTDSGPEVRIESLVEEIADKAASLKEAWHDLATTEETRTNISEAPSTPGEKKEPSPRRSRARKDRKSK